MRHKRVMQAVENRTGSTVGVAHTPRSRLAVAGTAAAPFEDVRLNLIVPRQAPCLTSFSGSWGGHQTGFKDIVGVHSSRVSYIQGGLVPRIEPEEEMPLAAPQQTFLCSGSSPAEREAHEGIQKRAKTGGREVRSARGRVVAYCLRLRLEAVMRGRGCLSVRASTSPAGPHAFLWCHPALLAFLSPIPYPWFYRHRTPKPPAAAIVQHRD